MTGVTHGADADRLSQIATDLIGSAHRTRDIAATGTLQVGVLTQAWQGPDVEDFMHRWEAASRSIGLAADHLDRAASELGRQADEQTGASRSTGGAPDVTISPEPDDGGGAGGGSGGEVDDEDAEGMSVLERLNHLLRKILDELGIVPLPEGLDHSDPVVQELRQTAEGRELLEWLHDNDITVVQGGSASQYSPGSDTIYLASDADVTSLIHEATHAQWDVEGKGVDITAVSRQEYIDAQLDNEVNAMVAEVEYLQATSDDPGSIDDQAYISYTQAQEAALADGASAEEADAAGRAAVRELFTGGYYETGNTGQSYPEYYGQAWDRRNP